MLGLTYLKDVRPRPARIDPFWQGKLVDKAGLGSRVEKLNVVRVDRTERLLRLTRLVDLHGSRANELNTLRANKPKPLL